MNSQDVLKGLNSTKLFEILHSIATPSHFKFVLKYAPPGFETFEV